jgi:hypothetical protein
MRGDATTSRASVASRSMVENAPSNSSRVWAGIIRSSTDSFWPALSIASSARKWDGVVGFQRTPIRVACGTASLIISRPLAASSVSSIDKPVTLPSGRARLATWPRPTGSAWTANTMGIDLVAFRAASTKVEDGATMTSTFKRTRSAARSGNCSTLSAHRHSMMMLAPSV